MNYKAAAKINTNVCLMDQIMLQTGRNSQFSSVKTKNMHLILFCLEILRRAKRAREARDPALAGARDSSRAAWGRVARGVGHHRPIKSTNIREIQNKGKLRIKIGKIIRDLFRKSNWDLLGNKIVLLVKGESKSIRTLLIVSWSASPIMTINIGAM